MQLAWFFMLCFQRLDRDALWASQRSWHGHDHSSTSPALALSWQVGFELVDALAAAEGISLGSMQCKAAIGKGRICGVPVVLAKPQTFMNLSGESVRPLRTLPLLFSVGQ